MMQVDAALLAGLVVCTASSGALLRYTAEVSRLQLAWLYFAAGFLKLTKYHSDWRLSCSSIYLSHIGSCPSPWSVHLDRRLFRPTLTFELCRTSQPSRGCPRSGCSRTPRCSRS